MKWQHLMAVAFVILLVYGAPALPAEGGQKTFKSDATPGGCKPNAFPGGIKPVGMGIKPAGFHGGFKPMAMKPVKGGIKR
jgi:hypothetical protein